MAKLSPACHLWRKENVACWLEIIVTPKMIATVCKLKYSLANASSNIGSQSTALHVMKYLLHA